MLSRKLKIAGRDEETFQAICTFMLDGGGQPPFLEDLVHSANEAAGLPNEKQKSISKSTISRSIFRLTQMGLISLRRDRGSLSRASGAIRVAESRFHIDITESVAKEKIRAFHEELDRERNTKK